MNPQKHCFMDNHNKNTIEELEEAAYMPEKCIQWLGAVMALCAFASFLYVVFF